MSELSGHHRETVRKIYDHPTSGNVEWRQVVSLLEALGTVVNEPNGKLRVTVGSASQVITRPRDKDVDKQLVVDLRQLLQEAGVRAE